MTRTDYAERYARMIDAAITLIDEQAAFWCTAQRYDAVTDEFFDAACTHCDLLAILEQEPPA